MNPKFNKSRHKLKSLRILKDLFRLNQSLAGFLPGNDVFSCELLVKSKECVHSTWNIALND